jgi:hypothetical protein
MVEQTISVVMNTYRIGIVSACFRLNAYRFVTLALYGLLNQVLTIHMV